MPCIVTRVNVEIPKQAEEALKTEFGKAISLLPGKSENWLMLSFQDNCRLYFRGKNSEPIAFVEVNLFGKADDAACDKLTAILTELLGKHLGIRPDYVYVKYEETAHWGWNGSNF